MTKERAKSPRARLFVALDLPDDVRKGLVSWQATALADPALRAVSPESLHMTLVFLGYRAERLIERIAELVLSAAGPAPVIVLARDPVPLPRRGAPRLFAIEARSEGAEALQAEVSERLVSERLYEPERRSFWPHLTVAKVRPESRGTRRRARVERPPGPLPQALCHPFRAVRLALYRSYLKPQGAEYVPMASVDLPQDH